MTTLAAPVRLPAAFESALFGLRAVVAAPDRADLLLQELPGPKRLAPHSVAVSAEVTRGDEQIASGRFVVLHDPEGQDGWGGDTRIVAFVSADVEAEHGSRSGARARRLELAHRVVAAARGGPTPLPAAP